MIRKNNDFDVNIVEKFISQDAAELTMIWEKLCEIGRAKLLAHFRAAALSQTLEAVAMGRILH